MSWQIAACTAALLGGGRCEAQHARTGLHVQDKSCNEILEEPCEGCSVLEVPADETYGVQGFKMTLYDSGDIVTNFALRDHSWEGHMLQ